MSKDIENKEETKKSNNIGLIVIVIVFVLCIIVMFAGTKAIKNNEFLKVFGFGFSTVPTESMKDTINVGDIIIINANVDYDELEVEDIIVYYYEEKGINVVHRIVGIYDDGSFETKGDNNITNPNSDEVHVTEDIYKGKVVWSGNFIGVGKLIANGRHFIFMAIILIFGYLLVLEIINLVKIFKLRDQEKIKEQNEKDLQLQKEKFQKEIRELFDIEHPKDNNSKEN